jgi:hypothetical protein
VTVTEGTGPPLAGLSVGFAHCVVVVVAAQPCRIVTAMIAASTANEKVVVFIGWILSFSRLINSAIAGLKGEKTATGRSALRPIQIRLTASSLIKSHRPVKRTGT